MQSSKRTQAVSGPPTHGTSTSCVGVVALARAQRGMMHAEFMQAFEQLRKPDPHISLARIGTLIDEARNELVATALQYDRDVSHVLFIDDDMIPPPDALLRLLAHRVPIVSGLAFERRPPHTPCAYVRNGTTGEAEPISTWGKELLEVDYCGAAFLLVERRVYDAVEPPWFKFDFPQGEDAYFLRRARGAGFKVMVDPQCVVGHLATFVVGEQDYRAYQAMQQRRGGGGGSNGSK